MKKIKFITILFFFICQYSISQKQETINLAMDYARFKMDKENSYVEFYYAYSPSEMQKKIVNGKNYTELLIKFTIIDTITKEVVVDRMWNLQNEFIDSQYDKYVIGQARFLLEYAPYLVKIFAMDLNNTSMRDSTSFIITVPYYKNDDLKISDIEICSSLKQIEKDTNNIFYKNTYEVKPNPFSIIDIQYPLLGYYLELYDINTKKIGDKITLKYSIKNNTGNEVLAKSVTKYVKNGSSVEAGLVNVAKLKGGAYNFIFTVLDSNGIKLAENSKRFFIYDPNVKSEKVDTAEKISTDEYVLMNEADLDKLFQQANYISTNDEKKQYAKLKTVEGKRNFMREFWANREGDELYNKKAYLERVKFAELRFRTKWSDGVSSDRGRVTLIYGIPEESYIERGKETTKGKPYEIWFYPTVMNGTYFIFVDESGFNSYRLVHSTHPNEIHDDEWKNFLQNRE